MAFSPIAFTAANYRDYANYWIKPYESGTTTPKTMATDSTLGTFIAKAEINVDGFIVSTGAALLIPYIDGSYDLWLFPTEAEADANDTTNALRLADNVTGINDTVNDPSSGLISVKTLAAAVSDTTAFDGKVVHISDRENFLFEYKTGQTPNTYNIVISSFDASLSLVLQDSDTGNPIAYGAVFDNAVTDDLIPINLMLANNTRINMPDLTARCSVLPDFSAGHILSAKGCILKIDDGQHTASNLSLLNAGGIEIQGKTVESITLDDLTSVTGGPGAWVVEGEVSDGSKVAIGDVIRIKDVIPGIISPGLISSRPPIGQMNVGFFQMGAISVVGTTCTVTSGVNTFLAAADLLTIKGNTRRILSITNDEVFELATALPQDVTGLQYWYYCDNIAAGQATASGTTVTLSGDFFDNFLEVGSLIIIDEGGIHRVTDVTSDNTCEVFPEFNNIISVGKSWGVIEAGENHEGAWVVSNVVSNTVTWTNKLRTAQSLPPIKNFVSANIDVMKTQLQFTGDAVSSESGEFKFSNIAMVGANAGTCFDLSSAANSSNADVNTNVSVANFAYGAKVYNKSYLDAEELQVSGCVTRGIDIADNGGANLKGSTINGTNGIGLFIGIGCTARFNDGRAMGNNLQGVRLEVGGSIWGDFAYLECNGGDGALCVGGVDIHWVGTRGLKNGGAGIEGQNGGFGRASGFLGVGNIDAGLRFASGNFEMNQANLIGNGTYPAVLTGGSYKLNEAGTSHNGSSGMLLLEAAIVSINTLQATDEGLSINCQNTSLASGRDVGFDNNATDAFVDTGGRIQLTDATAGFSANITKNAYDAEFSLIVDA